MLRQEYIAEQRLVAGLWTGALRQQIFMGNPDFVERMQARANAQAQQSSEIPKPQRAKPKQMTDWLAEIPDRSAALRAAYFESGIPMSELARELNLSVGRISQLIKKAGAAMKEDS